MRPAESRPLFFFPLARRPFPLHSAPLSALENGLVFCPRPSLEWDVLGCGIQDLEVGGGVSSISQPSSRYDCEARQSSGSLLPTNGAQKAARASSEERSSMSPSGAFPVSRSVTRKEPRHVNRFTPMQEVFTECNALSLKCMRQATPAFPVCT